MSLWDDQNICHSVVGKVCTVPGPGEAVLKLNVARQFMAFSAQWYEKVFAPPDSSILAAELSEDQDGSGQT